MVWDFREASGLLKPASPPCSSCTVRSVVSPFTSSAWRRASGRWRTSWRTGAAVAASSAMCVGDSTRPPRYPQSTGRKHTGETGKRLSSRLPAASSASAAGHPAGNRAPGFVHPCGLLQCPLRYSCSSCWSVTSAETAITPSAWAPTTRQNPPRRRKFG